MTFALASQYHVYQPLGQCPFSIIYESASSSNCEIFANLRIAFVSSFNTYSHSLSHGGRVHDIINGGYFTVELGPTGSPISVEARSVVAVSWILNTLHYYT